MKSFLLTAALLVPTLGFAASPTTSIDIGQVAVAGSTSTSNGVYTVRASGADIWGTEDEFRFVYVAMSGDGEITARVDSLTNTHSWTKAGVMIRETLNANSRYAYTLVSATNGVSFQNRRSTGALAQQPDRPTASRARRTGYVCVEPATCSRAYVSANGQTWRQQGGERHDCDGGGRVCGARRDEPA